MGCRGYLDESLFCNSETILTRVPLTVYFIFYQNVFDCIHKSELNSSIVSLLYRVLHLFSDNMFSVSTHLIKISTNSIFKLLKFQETQLLNYQFTMYHMFYFDLDQLNNSLLVQTQAVSPEPITSFFALGVFQRNSVAKAFGSLTFGEGW